MTERMTGYMSARDTFLEILHRNRRGERAGVCSICSAHPTVVAAAVQQAMDDDSILLIESTSNQVNQDGGYTGMTPKDFVAFVHRISDESGLPRERILFGGDHLGPNPWSHLPAINAMDHAREMVRQYAAAGYQKIHLDASMFLQDDAGDRTAPLPDDVVAARAAELCRAAEESWREHHGEDAPPVYIIGTEVPVPGGAQEEEDHVDVTAASAAAQTIEVTKEYFHRAGLQDVWSRVCGVVVQPGVEFGDDQVFHYLGEGTVELQHVLDSHPGLVYEAHSTDYQTEEGLSRLVRDHFCILKVGPWLTFAYREALFLLEHIEREVAPANVSCDQLSRLSERLDAVMVAEPDYWKRYYNGSSEELRYKRRYSYSDRSRYYWPHSQLKDAVRGLFVNLRNWGIPNTVISQYFPRQFPHVSAGLLPADPEALVLSRIRDVISAYARACGVAR